MNTVIIKVLAVVISCSPFPELHPAAQNNDNALSAYLTEDWTTPEDYIVSKFKDHDIVFIGEMHYIKHDPLLIQAVIPKLYQAGIYNLGMEFANFSDQEKIDRLTTGRRYDQDLARQILFDMFTTWGYQEYMDIFRAAWTVNRSLAKGAPRFRVVGLNYSPNYKLLTGPIDQLTAEQRKAVFYMGDDDAVMARVILKEFIDKNQKALIYSGINHALTHYRQPIYNFENKKLIRLNNERMGNYIYRKIGSRAFLIFLHSPWPSRQSQSPVGSVSPGNGKIDSVMAQFPNQRVGFDVAGTPFGQLRDSKAFYGLGHDDFKLEDFCDGYIYQMPFKNYQGVTTDPHFITKNNFAAAVQGILNFEARKNYKKPEDLIRVMRSLADIPGRFKAWGVLP
jgi:hypothetical protein